MHFTKLSFCFTWSNEKYLLEFAQPSSQNWKNAKILKIFLTIIQNHLKIKKNLYYYLLYKNKYSLI